MQNPMDAYQYGRDQFNRYKTWSQGHWLTRQANRSFAESFGFEWNKENQYTGFMGRKGWSKEFAEAKGITGKAGFAGSMLFRGANLALTGYTVYEGFKSGGLVGGAKGIGAMMAWNAATRALMNPAGLVAAATVGAAVAGYKFLEASQKNARQLRNIDMIDNGLLQATRSQGAYTTRQRSLQALQNTHINGRLSMGNEALFMHSSYR